MVRPPHGGWRGVFASVPCPLRPDFSIEEPALARLLAHLADTPGIAGFLVNGHAGESTLMPLADQLRVAEIAVEAVGGRAVVIAGVNAEASHAAAEHAAALEMAGADALMVVPPNGWALHHDTATALAHHEAILEATECPILIFQASVRAGGMAYSADTLAALVTLPRVVAVKEGSWEVAAYEANRRLVRAVAPQVAVHGSGDEHLFTSAVVGSEGAIVSLAAVAPAPVAALYEAIGREDLCAARAAHERIWPLARAIYGAPPGGRANARLKTCLRMLGRFDSDRMLPPAQPTPEAEHAALRSALAAAGLAPR